MKNLTRSLLVAALLLVAGTAPAAVQPGEDYVLLNPPQPTSGDKIEVLEFFFYGCSHCYDLHPQLSAWKNTMPKDVELIYLPVPNFQASWEPMARTFYALESLGQVNQLHDALFKAWHVDHIDLSDEAAITNFVALHGVDRAKFSAAYNSFSMQSKVVRAKQMVSSYGIRGTPTLVVDGKYVLTGTKQGVVNGERQLVGLAAADKIRVLNEVIAMARKDHHAAPAEGKPSGKAKTKH